MQRRAAAHLRARGLALVELMVAVTVGMLITAGVLGLFVTSSAVYDETDDITELQENSRFALDYLVNELRHAGFFGQARLHSIEKDDSLATVFDDCSGEAAALDFQTPLFGDSASGTTALGCMDDVLFVDGIPSDILVVKSVRPYPYRDEDDSGVIGDTEDYDRNGRVDSADRLQIGRAYVASNAQTGRLLTITSSDERDAVPSVAASGLYPRGAFWEYSFSAYYIRPGDDSLEDPPVLARKRLDWNGTRLETKTEDLVEGVEGMRLLYGFDSDEDGIADSYVGAEGIDDWNDVRQVAVHLLLRAQEPDHSYTDTKQYQLGDRTVTVTKSATAAQGAELRNFRRMVVSTTVHLRNMNLMRPEHL